MNTKAFGKFLVLMILAQLVSAVAFAADPAPTTPAPATGTGQSAVPCEAAHTGTSSGTAGTAATAPTPGTPAAGTADGTNR